MMVKFHAALLATALIPFASISAQTVAPQPEPVAEVVQQLETGPAEGPQASPQPPATRVFWSVFWLSTIFLDFLLLLILVGLLRSKNWSMGDALSEEAGNQPKELPPGTRPEMVASSSRLIALLGLVVILSIYLGVGYHLLWRLFTTGDVPDLTNLTSFLYGGAVIFAPYLVNQLKEAFTAFAPK